MAVIYSRLGGCFGETAKSGPLASTDLCALVKGLLDRLITPLWVRIFKGGRTLGTIMPIGKGGRHCFLGSTGLGR